MPTLPSASVSIEADAGALAGGTGYCTVFACVGTNDDITPRIFSSARALLAQHDYSPGADFAADHIDSTGQPVQFIGLPITTPGAVVRFDDSEWTGGSAPTVSLGADGALEEVDAIVTCTTEGTIGTNGTKLSLSLDGGVTEKPIKLGTATSYVIPYVGITLNFAAGDINEGDVFTFKTTAPMWGTDDLTAARVALTKQQKLARSWMIIGDVSESEDADAVTTEANTYRTANARFTLARVNVRDHLPLASMSRSTVRMSGSPTITFLEVGMTGDTITRSSGSFISDGFIAGMVVTVAGAIAGTGHNNVTGAITVVTDTVLTLDSADLVNEGPISGVTILGSYGLVFTTTTATRSGGSWIADGFTVGDSVTFDGTISNDAAHTLTDLTATVMTFASGGVAETIGTRDVSVTKGETMAAWVSAMDAEFTDVDAQPRIDIGLGRGRKKSPLTGWSFRRPASWHASIREYQHDIHIPTWAKELGPLDGVSLEDANGTIVEYDERTDGGALAGRFTCLRTWGNGPNGTFIAMSLTRDGEGSLLSYTHNMHVTNLACTIVQKATENVVGKVLQLDDEGHATKASLGQIEESINTDLAIALLQEHVLGAGPRASKATWKASATDILNVVDATLTGGLDLHVNGTIVHVDTVVKVS